jgi:hypothetical protein
MNPIMLRRGAFTALCILLTLLSPIAAPGGRMSGGHAICLATESQLQNQANHVVVADSLSEYYTTWPYQHTPPNDPIEIFTVLNVDGVVVYQNHVVGVSEDSNNPTVIPIHWEYNCGSSGRHVEFYEEDYCEIQDEPTTFFYHSLYSQ